MVSISSARILPSASKAMRAFVWWSRACASDISASARVEVHLTGRFSSIEAQTTVETSNREMAFQPEPAADIWRDHAELVLGNMERVLGEPALEIVRRLAGRPERDVAGRLVEFGQIGARFQRTAGDTVGIERQRDGAMRGRERGFRRRAVAALDLEDQVGDEPLVQHGRVPRRGCARCR